MCRIEWIGTCYPGRRQSSHQSVASNAFSDLVTPCSG
jgi:hypothetical protein